MGEFFSQLFGLVQNLIVAPLIYLFPVKWAVVLPGSAAVRYTFGNAGPVLGRGIHFYTTGQTIAVEHIHRRTLVTDEMATLTSEGIPIGADAVIIYRIQNLAVFLVSAEDPHVLLASTAEAFLRAAIQASEFSRLLMPEDIESDIRDRLNHELSDVGVIILSARFQRLCHLDPVTRAIRGAQALGVAVGLSTDIQMTAPIANGPAPLPASHP